MHTWGAARANFGAAILLQLETSFGAGRARHKGGWIHKELLPRYAPELNPVVYIWVIGKHHELPKVCPKTTGNLGLEENCFQCAAIKAWALAHPAKGTARTLAHNITNRRMGVVLPAKTGQLA